tara:strand:+ start:501 stop:935 length:435 start_codon:yes stop_codon:yes gene_type:complete
MYTSTHIRKISASDNIEEYLNCVQDLMRSGTENVSNIKLKLKRQKDDYETYVYLLDGKIVGTTSMLFEYKLRYSKPKAYIEDVAVDRDYRGMGIAKKLINFCFGVAKQRQCYKIVLSCDDSLISFYERLGFTKKENFMAYGLIN